MSSKEFEMFAGQADKLAAQGKLDEAVEMYQRALQIDPCNPVVKHNIINIYMKSGNFQATIDEYLSWAKTCQDKGLVEDALAVYHELINLENQAAKKSFLMGQRGAVGEIIKELVGNVRTDIFYNVGLLLQTKGQLDDSIEYLKASLDLSQPEDAAKIHMALGQAFMRKGMDKEAVGEFQEVVRLTPMEAAYAYEMLGEIYLRGGRTPQGTIVWFKNAGDLYLKNNQIVDTIRVFERVLNFDSKNKDVLGRLGEIYAQKGQNDKAADCWSKLADIYSNEGLLDKVVVLYEKLIEANPDNVDIRNKLIKIYREILDVDQGNLSARHKLIGLLLNSGANDEAVSEFLLLASTYYSKGMLDEGISVCENMLDIDPDNVKANELLAEIYYKQGNTDLALDQFLHVVKLYRSAGDNESASALNKELIKKFPQQIELYYQQAIEEKEKGNLESAIKILNSIINDNPSFKQAMLAKADIMQSMNRWNEALAMYKRILELEPNHIEVRKILLERYISDGQLPEALEETRIIADAIFVKGDYREVETLYRRMLAYLPDNAELRERICDVQIARGHNEKALAGYFIILNIYRQLELVDSALRICNKILELSPDNIFASRAAATLYKSVDKAEAVSRYASLADFYISKSLDTVAAAMILEILNLQPQERDYRQKLIDIYVKAVRFDEATIHYRILFEESLNSDDIPSANSIAKEMIALQPFNLELREELAAIYLERELIDEVISIDEELVHLYAEKENVEKVIELNTKLSELYEKKGNRAISWDYAQKVAENYYKAGKIDDSINKFISVLVDTLKYDEFERESMIFVRLAEIFTAESRLDEAIERFETLTAEFVESGNLTTALVLKEQIRELYEKQGNIEKSLSLLEEIAGQYSELSNYSEALRIRELISSIYVTSGRVEDATENYFSIIELLLKQSLPTAALESYKKLQELRGEDATSIQRTANMLFNAGFMNYSKELYEKLLTLKSESYDTISQLAIIYASEGDYATAITYSRKVLTKGVLGSVITAYRKLTFDNMDEGSAHINLGRFYESMGFYEEAIEEYDAASKSEETALPSLNAIGNLLYRQGFFDLAILQYKVILDMDASDEEQQDTRYNLAQAYYDHGLYEDALNMYQECYAIDIRYRDVADKIVELSQKIAD